MWRTGVFCVLVALAVVILSVPKVALLISGYRPLGKVTAAELDEMPQVVSAGATEFFQKRNRIELEVPRDMQAGELLELYQLHAFPHVREEIADQLGSDGLPDTTELSQGQRFAITLTPPEDRMP